MVHVKAVLTTALGFLTMRGLAFPASLDSNTSAPIEFDSAFFHGALPTEELGIVGPVVSPSTDKVNTATAQWDKQKEIRITMGTSSTHVGFTVAAHPGAQLRNTLEKLCGISDKINNPDAAPPADAQIPGPMCNRKDVLHIENIYSKYNHRYNRDFIRVQVESDYISNTNDPDHLALLKHFIDQIVQAFEASIACDKNRYVQHLVTKCFELSNSADWYQVGIHEIENGFFPHLRVRLTYNGDSSLGQWDCKGSLTNTWSTLPESRVKEYADLMGVPMRGAIACADRSGLVEGKPSGHCEWDRKALFYCGVAAPGECIV